MTDKPTVLYRGEAFVYHDLSAAWLTTVNHPNHLAGHDVRNDGLPVKTSRVIAHDVATGRIETKNTIYIPEKT